MQTPSGSAQHWTKRKIVQALAAFVRLHGRVPHSTEWRACHGLPSHKTVYRIYGPLADLTRRFRPAPQRRASAGRPVRWTLGQMLAAIRAFHRRTGAWPTTDDFTAAAGLPHAVTVHRHFGTLAEARRQAGMPGGGHEGLGGSGRGGGWTRGKRRGL